MSENTYKDPYSIDILPTKIDKHDYKDSLSLSKDIYITCSCGDLGHMGRVSFYCEILKVQGEDHARLSVDDVSFEFNALDWKTPTYTYEFKNRWDKIRYPFFKIYNRIRGAVRILFGLPVYFSTGTLLPIKGAKDLARSILEAIDQLESEAFLCSNQKHNKK